MTRYSESIMNTFGPPKRVLVRGAGAEVFDDAGNKYLDLLAGIAVNSLGHAHPAMIAATNQQMSTLGHVSNFFATEPQMALAEKLVSLVNAPGKVFFANSGAEANEAALKLTRLTSKTHIVAAEGSFHGRTMGALSVTHKPSYREPFEPLIPDVTFVEYGNLDALENAVTDQTAAIVLEPIQGEAGVVDPQVGYLAHARALADRHSALLWFDEVQTGMGRTGTWFAFEHAAVQPDIITLAKGLGGGFPIGACIALGVAADLFQPGHHGSTFGGNPVACATALAVIDVIESENLLSHVTQMGKRFRIGLAPHVQATTGAGLLIGLVLGGDYAPAIQNWLLDHGVIANAPTPNRLRLAPPFVISPAQVDHAVDTIVQALTEVTP